MKTVRDLLVESDPLRHEPDRLSDKRSRLRHAILEASPATIPSPRGLRISVSVIATVIVIVFGIIVGSQIWSPQSTALQAAIRFEVRLAEDRPAAGLREAQVRGSGRVIYLHQEIIVTNGDIAESRITPGDGRSGFGISVQFNPGGTRRMRQATAGHVGKPVAVLLDGEIVMAPTLRSAIAGSAVITGNFTQADAERIVNGIINP